MGAIATCSGAALETDTAFPSRDPLRRLVVPQPCPICNVRQAECVTAVRSPPTHAQHTPTHLPRPRQQPAESGTHDAIYLYTATTRSRSRSANCTVSSGPRRSVSVPTCTDMNMQDWLTAGFSQERQKFAAARGSPDANVFASKHGHGSWEATNLVRKKRWASETSKTARARNK
jgi:hypothetical protein